MNHLRGLVQIPSLDSAGLKWDLGFSGGSVIKNLPASAGDVGSIPGWGDPLEKEMATLSTILVWEIPWTEEPGSYS